MGRSKLQSDLKRSKKIQVYFCCEFNFRQSLESPASCPLLAVNQPDANSCCPELDKSMGDGVMSWILGSLFGYQINTRGPYLASETCVQYCSCAESC